MIPTDLLRQLPAQLRASAAELADLGDAVNPEEVLTLEQAADVAEELLRLRRWQRNAANVITVLRRNATGQEPLEPDNRDYWIDYADRLTERRVMDEGAAWEPPPMPDTGR